MGLKGILVTKTEIKKSHGDVFRELFIHTPHHVAKFTSEKIQSIELHEGEYGKVGSVLSWNYTHEGKHKSFKTVVEAVDEEKKSITFRATEGEVLESYKKFAFTLHVEHTHDHIHGHEEKDEEEHSLTWTFEYEKKHEEIPAPTSYLDFALDVTKDIQVHHHIKK